MRFFFRTGAFVAVLAASAAGTAAGTAAAQQMRGTVRDSASQAPIPGAVVVLLDSSGRALGRNITNEQGRYVVALTAGARRMQVLRLGFHPREVPIPATGGTTQLDVSMATIPTLLDPISVTDQPACSRRDDRIAAFALWEQARAALLGIVVAREAEPAHVVRLHFDRRLAGNGDEIVSQSVRIDSAATGRPFAAWRTAAGFVEKGFVGDTAGGRLFAGPDADVMLDDAFVRGYCFHLVAATPARPHEIGLGFAPARRQAGRVDIEGALWIDSMSRSLKDIEFHYIGLAATYDRFHPGGHVSFRSMGNGTVLIDRWFIRTVGYARVVQNSSPLQRLFSRTLQAVETGGEVADARWSDGSEWHASLGTLRGHLTHPGGVPARGAMVELVDTDYRATADSTGTFEISNLLPGPYQVGAVDEALAELGLLLKSTTRFVAVRDSTVTVSLDVPTGAAYVAGKCSADANSMSNAVLIVRTLLPNGSPAAGAAIEIRAVDPDGYIVRLGQGEADDLGLFHFCRAPANRLQVHAEQSGYVGASRVQEMNAKIVTVTLRLGAPR